MPLNVILATAGYDHTIRFWEPSGMCHRTIQHPDSVRPSFLQPSPTTIPNNHHPNNHTTTHTYNHTHTTTHTQPHTHNHTHTTPHSFAHSFDSLWSVTVV